MATDKQEASGLKVGAAYSVGVVLPDFPKLPADVVKRFVSLQKWEVDVKAWVTKANFVLKDGT